MASKGDKDVRGAVSDLLFEGRVLRDAGVIAPMRPDKALRVARTFLRWGASPATGVATAAIEHPHEIAILDERGALTWDRLHRRSNALAHAFAAMGIGPGDGVGVMARNHRGFLETTLATAKLGASALYLNTMFSGPQLVDVMKREGPKALVYDEEFEGLLAGVEPGVATGRRLARRRPARGEDDGRAADRRRRRLRPPAAARQAALRHPHLGHHGDAEGRPADQPGRADGAGRGARHDPLPQPPDDDDRGAALPLLGLLPLRHEPADRLDHGAAPPLRSGGDAAGDRTLARRRARRGAGDGAADPRPAGRGALSLQAALAAGRLAVGLGPAGRAGDRVDGPLRRHRSTTSTARPRSPTRPSPPRPTCAPPPAPPAGRRGARW